MGAGTFGVLKSLPRVLGIAAIIVSGTEAAAGARDIVGRQAAMSDLAPRGSIETVHFADPKQPPVRIVRGTDPIGGVRMRREIITFGGGTAQHVAVFRGISSPSRLPMRNRRDRDLRGSAAAASYVDYGPRICSALKLMNISVALPMRCTASNCGMAPICACGGWTISADRRGRCRLAPRPRSMSAVATGSICTATSCSGALILFGCTGNTAIGRTRWRHIIGDPGSVDHWIARGRLAAQLPAETTRYIERVLRLALAGITQQRISR